MSNRIHLIALAALSSLALSACGAQVVEAPTEEPDAEQIESALEQENGGMSAEDEAIDEAAYADLPPMQTFADHIKIPVKEPRAVYTVLVMWGHLPRYDGVDPTRFTDWSGSVQVTGGFVRLDRPVAFDREDRILPRRDPRVIRFISKTLPLTDGLLMHVMQVEPDARLTIDTKAMRMQVRLSDIGRQMYDHQRLNRANGMSFLAYRNRKGCADGFVIGRYRRMNRKVGRFHFFVTDDHGKGMGFVRGIYGYSKRAKKDVFFGKYLSLDGHHRGFTVGRYGDHRFVGGWRVDVPGAKGMVEGLYWEGRDDKPGHGLAFGHWAEKCPAEPKPTPAPAR